LVEELAYLEEETNLNVNTELTQPQHDKASQFLMNNINIFAKNVIEEGQSK
ncbi:18372_t:CDS:1, partial [Racocetra persica]